MVSNNVRALLLGAVSVVFWSISAPFSKALNGLAEFPVIVTFMQIGAVSALLAFSLIQIESRQELEKDFRRLFLFTHDSSAPREKKSIITTWLLLFAFGISMTAYHSLFFYALQNGPSLQLNMINYLWPIILVLIYIMLGKGERGGSYLQFALIPLAFFGALIIGFDGAEIGGIQLSQPLLAALGCALIAPVYMALAPWMIERRYIANARNVHVFALSVTALAQLIIYGATGELRGVPSLAIIESLLVGISSIAIAHVCWTQALQVGHKPTISTMIYLTPVLSSFWLVAILEEPVSGQFALGASVILLANVLMSRAIDELMPMVFALVVCAYVMIGWFGRNLLGAANLDQSIYAVIPGIFSILAGFVLSRTWQRNAELEKGFIGWACDLRSMLADSTRRSTAAQSRNLQKQIDEVMQKTLVLKIPGRFRAVLVQELVDTFAQMHLTLERSVPAQLEEQLEWRQRVRALETGFMQWLNRLQERSDRVEFFVIMLLGFGSIASLVVKLQPGAFSVMFSLVFSFCIAYIVAEIRMYEHMSLRLCLSTLAHGPMLDLFEHKKLFLPERWLLLSLVRRGTCRHPVRVREPDGTVLVMECDAVAEEAERIRKLDLVVMVSQIMLLALMVYGLLASFGG